MGTLSFFFKRRNAKSGTTVKHFIHDFTLRYRPITTHSELTQFRTCVHRTGLRFKVRNPNEEVIGVQGYYASHQSFQNAHIYELSAHKRNIQIIIWMAQLSDLSENVRQTSK